MANTGSGEAPGTWMGSGAADLGLAGQVTPEDLRAVLAGISPANGAPLGHLRRSGNRVAGFDLTFSSPKSGSLLYALGSPEQAAAARAAHHRWHKTIFHPDHQRPAAGFRNFPALPPPSGQRLARSITLSHRVVRACRWSSYCIAITS